MKYQKEQLTWIAASFLDLAKIETERRIKKDTEFVARLEFKDGNLKLYFDDKLMLFF